MKKKILIQKLISDKIETLCGKSIGLLGDLGSGKTDLVKNLVAAIEPSLIEKVSSPTFSYCNIYLARHISIHHYDLYRVETFDHLYEIDLFESLSDQTVITIIEWPDLFPEVLKQCEIKIKINVLKNNERCYQIVAE